MKIYPIKIINNTSFQSVQSQKSLKEISERDKKIIRNYITGLSYKLKMSEGELTHFHKIRTRKQLEKEAYKYIEEGKFNKDYLENVQDEITIRLVRLNYLRDTKGLLQPVYEFVTNGNGIIYVPAIH